MRGGVILIVVALIVGYMGVTGKYKCFTTMLGCLTGSGSGCDCKPGATTPGAVTTPTSSPGSFPTVAPLPTIPPLTPPWAGKDVYA